MSVVADVRFVVKNMREFRAAMDREAVAVKKASEAAIKVEGFRLMKLMQKELRAGAAGGRALEPLRFISSIGRRNPKPLAPLARNAVRYMATQKGKHLQVSVGFLHVKSSRSWVRIAEKQQEGYTTSADSLSAGGTTTLRKSFIRRGARMKDGNRIRKYFFLRKGTTSLKTPARNVIEPFWQAHEREAERNIISNFNRKMAGERI